MYVENSFLKGNGLKKRLENLVVKNLIVTPSLPTHRICSEFGFNKTDASCCKTFVLGVWQWQWVSVEGMEEAEKAMACCLVLHWPPRWLGEDACQTLNCGGQL